MAVFMIGIEAAFIPAGMAIPYAIEPLINPPQNPYYSSVLIRTGEYNSTETYKDIRKGIPGVQDLGMGGSYPLVTLWNERGEIIGFTGLWDHLPSKNQIEPGATMEIKVQNFNNRRFREAHYISIAASSNNVICLEMVAVVLHAEESGADRPDPRFWLAELAKSCGAPWFWSIQDPKNTHFYPSCIWFGLNSSDNPITFVEQLSFEINAFSFTAADKNSTHEDARSMQYAMEKGLLCGSPTRQDIRYESAKSPYYADLIRYNPKNVDKDQDTGVILNTSQVINYPGEQAEFICQYWPFCEHDGKWFQKPAGNRQYAKMDTKGWAEREVDPNPVKAKLYNHNSFKKGSHPKSSAKLEPGYPFRYTLDHDLMDEIRLNKEYGQDFERTYRPYKTKPPDPSASIRSVIENACQDPAAWMQYTESILGTTTITTAVPTQDEFQKTITQTVVMFREPPKNDFDFIAKGNSVTDLPLSIPTEPVGKLKRQVPYADFFKVCSANVENPIDVTKTKLQDIGVGHITERLNIRSQLSYMDNDQKIKKPVYTIYNPENPTSTDTAARPGLLPQYRTIADNQQIYTNNEIQSDDSGTPAAGYPSAMGGNYEDPDSGVYDVYNNYNFGSESIEETLSSSNPAITPKKSAKTTPTKSSSMPQKNPKTTQAAKRKRATNSRKRRRTKKDDHETNPRNKNHKRWKHIKMSKPVDFGSQIVKSSQGHSAKELCEHPNSAGPDAISMKEKLFCDMQEKKLYPLCSDELEHLCFDLEKHHIRPPNLHGRSGPLPKSPPVKKYKRFTHWEHKEKK